MLLEHHLRREILIALSDRELSARELARHLRCRRPTLSQHLSVLREDGAIGSRTAGKQRIYGLVPERAAELWDEWVNAPR